MNKKKVLPDTNKKLKLKNMNKKVLTEK